jgi:hypothetical protein
MNATDSPKQLSSSQTFFVKYIFWPAVLLFFWFAGSLHWNWWDLAPLVFFTAFFLWSAVPLKRVRIDGRYIYVSNYRKEIAVPLEQIEAVTKNRWVNSQPVTVRFRSATAFGSRITFIPRVQWYGPSWRTHPVVEELRRASLTARL